MRYLIMFGIFAALLLAGCTETPINGIITPEDEEQETCTTVTEEIPSTEEVCEEVSFTEEVCGTRKLEYTSTLLPQVDLCIKDGECVGQPLKNCPNCDKAMSRCVLIIKNEEQSKSGTWTVAADYTIGSSGFNKDPITHTIGPNESVAFDFDQIYSPGTPINSARCNLYITDEPEIEDCIDETRTRLDCQNVTTTKTIQKEVCE